MNQISQQQPAALSATPEPVPGPPPTQSPRSQPTKLDFPANDFVGNTEAAFEAFQDNTHIMPAAIDPEYISVSSK